MRKTSKILIAIIIGMLIILISTGIYAYFTFQASVKDTIILGYNEVVVNQIYEPPQEYTKGLEITKEPYVTNVGNVDCYVRVKSVVSDSRIEQDLIIDYNNSEKFVYNSEDEYYYYTDVLHPGESTEKLFTKVTIKPDADDLVLEGFDILIYAESVQTVDGKTMSEVWSYFDE